MSVQQSIISKLTRAFSPAELEVIDDSERHRGHSGYREGGETHFSVRIVSEAFAGKSRIERHRMVNALLAEELSGRVHALALSIQTPEERQGGA
ncbi:MAG TPA: BolA family protein [Hyphomicrobiales bacterium]|nr:BolA family protein [Hyphomicrobiales bacterium]